MDGSTETLTRNIEVNPDSTTANGNVMEATTHQVL